MNPDSMNPDQVVEAVGSTRVVPVLTIHEVADAAPVALALIEGGINIVEVTLRTSAGLESIRSIASETPEMILGAGSVTTAKQATAAIGAGAQFLVSPGLSDDVIGIAHAQNIAVIPGIATPTELMRAVELGMDVVKLFPAEVLGGVPMVRALAAVWPAMRFMPTGGISAQNIASYLDLDEVLAVGGTWMVPNSAIASEDWSSITAAARQCVADVAAAS